MSCPSCGAEINHDQLLAVVSVCDYCNTAVIYDAQQVKNIGKMAALAAPESKLYKGAAGDIKGVGGFNVLGRIRYGYGAGFWEEWYIQKEDGNTAWISEDEKRLSLETPHDITEHADHVRNLSLSDSMHFGDTEYVVTEIIDAECEGGEGQLPFRILSGEKIRYYDLQADGGLRASIEVEPDGEIKLYTGSLIETFNLNVYGEKAQKIDFEKEGRTAINSKRSKAIQCHSCGGTNDKLDLHAAEINCQYCGTSLESPPNVLECPSCSFQVSYYGTGASTVNCPKCLSLVNISDKPKLLHTLKGKMLESRKKRELPIPLGSKVIFDNLLFTLVGFVRSVEDSYYFNYEYLLYNKTWGYRWLFSYDGHFMLQEKMDSIPKINISHLDEMDYKTSFNFDDEKWKMYEAGETKIDWVEGELPWVAKYGDKSTYYDMIAPPAMLCCEVSTSEAEWGLYRYVDKDELAEAFDLHKSKLPYSRGVGAAQVNHKAPRQKYAGSLALMALILAVVGLAVSYGAGKKVHSFTVSNSEYREEFLSKSFTLPQSNSNYKIMFSAPVDNSWLYFDWALVNSDEKAIINSSAEISYYHGVEGGESWSEGSRKDNIKFRLDEAGDYKLLLLGQAGQGSSDINITRGEKVNITIYKNVLSMTPFVLLTLICFAMAAINWIGVTSFEARRWKHTYEDDD